MAARSVFPALVTVLVDVGLPLLERIFLLADENRAARLVCKQWRDIVDYSEYPFWLRRYGNTKPEALLVLKGPSTSEATQGCVSWCRRNGHRHDAVELRDSSSWWFLPAAAAPLCYLSNVTSMTLSWSHLAEEHSLGLLSSLTRLQSLELRRVSIEESSLQPLTCLTTLRHLALMDCHDVWGLKPVGQLTSLTRFSMYDGEYGYLHITDLHDLCQLTGLQSLETDIWDFRGISNLVSLTRFALEMHMDDQDIHWDEDGKGNQMLELNCLPKLSELHLWQGNHKGIELLQNSSVTSFKYCCACGSDPAFVGQLKGAVPNVRHLSLQYCDLADLSGLSAMKHLEVLDVTSNSFVEEIMLDPNSLRGLTMLKVLHLASSDVCKPGVDLSLLKNAGVQIILE